MTNRTIDDLVLANNQLYHRVTMHHNEIAQLQDIVEENMKCIKQLQIYLGLFIGLVLLLMVFVAYMVVALT